MARNIEIKARIESVEALLPRAAALADGDAQVLFQDDSFFACTHGRLKLRDFGDGRGELIAYERPDVMGPRSSSYRITTTADPAGLRAALTTALGQTGRVRKQRWLLRAGRTRVHLDRVDGLGDFLEIEVVLADDADEADGEIEAQGLMRALGVDASRLVAVAYVDLLAAQGRSRPRQVR